MATATVAPAWIPWTPWQHTTSDAPGVYLLDAHALALLQAWQAAGVPRHFQGCRFATFPGAAGLVAACQAWLAGARPGLMLHGAYGVGKTGLAASLLWAALQETGTPGRFVTVPDLLDTLRASYRADDAPDVLADLKQAPLLVIDDLGAERITGWVQERLFVLINARHSNPQGRTIFTSNLPPSQLGAHLGERIAWRIVEMSAVLKVDGRNLRDRRAS